MNTFINSMYNKFGIVNVVPPASFVVYVSWDVISATRGQAMEDNASPRFGMTVFYRFH